MERRSKPSNTVGILSAKKERKISSIRNIPTQNIVLTIFFNCSYLAKKKIFSENLNQVFKMFFWNLLVCEI